MSIFLVFIGLIVFAFGIYKLLNKKSTTSKNKKWLILIIGIVLMILGIMTAKNPYADKSNKETTSEMSSSSSLSNSAQSTSSEIKIDQSIVDQLKSDLQNGDMESFLRTYYDQPENTQGKYYDATDAYNTTASVNGTAFETNSTGSRLYIYIPVETPKTDWDNITTTKQNAYVVVAKAEDGTFTDDNVGKNVTVTGQLQSRGDLKLGYNWDLYNAQLSE